MMPLIRAVEKWTGAIAHFVLLLRACERRRDQQDGESFLLYFTGLSSFSVPNLGDQNPS